MDLAAGQEVLKFQNKIAKLRFESLIKSLGVLFVAANGGDAKKFIEAAERNDSDDADELDDDNTL